MRKKTNEKSMNVTIFDKEIYKFSPTKIVKEFNNETITKEPVILFSRDNTNSLRDENVENLNDIN